LNRGHKIFGNEAHAAFAAMTVSLMCRGGAALAVIVPLVAGCRPHSARMDAESIAKPSVAEQVGVVEPLPPLRPEAMVIANRPILPFLSGAEPTREQTLQDAAASALARIGPDAVPGLIGALGDRDAEVRADAAHALALMGPKASVAVPALTHALADPDENVERAAARALGQIGPAARDAIPSLLDLLKKERVPSAPPNRGSVSPAKPSSATPNRPTLQ
jgi:HEAT repeat protein